MDDHDIDGFVQNAIRESGTSLRQLAKSSGVNLTVLGRYMRGERGITVKSLSKLARALGLHMAKDAR